MTKNGSAKRRNHTKSWLENLESRVLLSTIYVDAGAVGVPDGASWATAYPNLQQALTAAVANDRIQVAGGVYKPTGDADRDVSFELRTDVVVAGGYAGSANAGNPDLRDPTTYATILSGDIGVADDSDDNSHHVVKAMSIGGTAELDGVVIANGMADLVAADRQFGGGLYVSDSTLTVRDSVFLNNTAVTMGGGVYLAAASNVTFVGNTFDDNAAGIGGGAAIDGASTASFTGDVFLPNGASAHGGAVGILTGSEAALTGVTVTGNVAVGQGGAIHNDGGTLTVRDSRFHANRAGTNGGAVYDKDSAGTSIINSTFVGNTAVLGAGIYVLDTVGPAVSIVNSTFNANAASQGGAVYNNSTVVPTIANSVLWGNGAGGEVFNAIPGSDAVVTYSAVQGGYAGTGNVAVDPLLRRGASAGVDGLWATTDDDYGDLRLQMTSPAIDAGNNAAVPGGITTDLAGGPRFLDVSSRADTGAGVAPIVDMGALETLGFPTVSFDLASQSNAETGTVTVVVELDGVRDYPVTIPFTLTGTASGADYTASASPLVIPAGQTSGTITIQITQDDLPESDETVIITLGEPASGTLGTPVVHTVTITDTDAPVMNPVGGQTVQAGQSLAFGVTVVAAATPITFSLVGTVPAGASITADGQFTWTPAADLPAGVYTVTIRAAQAEDAAIFTEQTVNVTVTAVPVAVLGSVTGTLFNDLSGEGKRAANELGLVGRSVFLDVNFNGVLDAGELVTTTDAAGNYAFADLPVGSYSVRPVAPAGWRASGAGVTYATVVGQAPAAAAPLSITTRQLIRGLIFNDLNGNKRQNAGEKGLFNFRVYIDLNRNGQFDKGEPVAKSARSGAFAFSTLKLKAGKYLLRMIPNANYSTVSPKAATFPVTLKSGTTLLNRNFAQKANR